MTSDSRVLREAGVIVQRRSGPLSLDVRVTDDSGGWIADLTVVDAPSDAGDVRLAVAARRLLELDAAFAKRLHRSGHASVFVSAAVPRREGPFRSTELIVPLLLPPIVQDELYPYQLRGVEWLLNQDRALLGDDMGLGKTAQALAALRRGVREGTCDWCLVVAPRTLIANWEDEAHRWAPELAVTRALPPGGQKEASWKRLAGRAHIVVTSYEQMRDPPEALLARTRPNLIIADEAHRLRKLDSQTSQGFRRVRTQRFWALTGTPVERDAADLAVLMSHIEPLRFSPDDRDLHATSLRAKVRPYVLRRHKSEVLRDLPDTIHSHELIELSREQRAAYRHLIQEHHRRRQGEFLALFTKLRAVCDLDVDSGASSKLDRICEKLADVAAGGERAVVFSYQLAPLHALYGRLTGAFPCRLITGAHTLEEREEAITHFKSQSGCVALLASTRIAAEGLTLTEANHAFFVNRWWNPSANEQAIDRIRRIGQARTVNVHTYTCRGTVEERLDSLLAEKRLTFEELIGELASGGESMLSSEML